MVIRPSVIKKPIESDRNISFLSFKSTLFKTENKVAPTRKLPNNFNEPILADKILGAQNEVIKDQSANKRNKMINGRPRKLIFRFWIFNIINPKRLVEIAKSVIPLGAINPTMGKMSAILAKR